MSAARQSGGLNEQQKKMIAIAVFVVVGGGILVYELQDMLGGSTPAPPPAAVIVTKTPEKPTQGKGATVVAPPGFAARGTAKNDAKKVGTSSGELDPTLHMEAMLVTESLVYTGRGRNIFATGPTVTETVVAAVQHKAAPLPQPIVPVRVVETGPPPPPPINLKFFGTASRGNGDRRAFLLHGDDVFLASPGDVVDRRYKVISIAASSIVVEDLPTNNRQTLPLQAN